MGVHELISLVRAPLELLRSMHLPHYYGIFFLVACNIVVRARGIWGNMEEI